MITGRNRFPFSATQWQELEHQALIFKYMASGTPIPPDLLFTIRRSLDSSLSSKLILHQPQHIGWNCFQMGFGRKIDPEPGRCRRTDGKKWRCSKEAYPESKYCERHMHRGRNRSRKHVEAVTSTTTTTNNSPLKTSPPTAIPISSITKNPSPSLSNSPLSSMVSDTGYTSHLHHHFLYPHSSSSRPPGIALSSQENTTNLFLDSSLCPNPEKNYRYGYAMKEEADENPFYSESSGSVRSYSGSSVDDPWQLTPLTMGVKQRTCSGLQSEYPFLQLEGLTGNSRQQNEDQRFHDMASDFKNDMQPLNLEREEKPQKVMHHFFDERPKNRDPWLDSEGRSSSHYAPLSTTQLSISTPSSSHDFFTAHSRN